MNQFELAFKFVMDHEDWPRSGKVTHDAGGCTRWGIAQRYNPEVDVANLTLDQAKAIYKAKYFDPFRLFELTDARVAAKLCDMIVNPGPVSVKLAQSIAGVAADGVMGPHTIAALNAIEPDQLLEHLCIAQAAYYEEHDKGKPEYAGLLNRAKGKPVDVNNAAPTSSGGAR